MKKSTIVLMAFGILFFLVGSIGYIMYNTDLSNLEIEEFEEKKIKLNIKDSEIVNIILDSENTKIDSEGVQGSGQIVTIKKSGNYKFSGVLHNGQIVVETEDEKDVQIILSGVDINNDFGPAILVKQAKQTVINVTEKTSNTLSDGVDYSIEDENDGTGGAIFSKDDVIINGKGNLIVNGNLGDGIVSKDKLFIDSGNIEVNAKDDGIRGKDYLLINNAYINIASEADGLKSNNESKATIVINGGNINISSGDDAIHSEIYLVINGGNINVSKSYEGLEARYITLNDGDINITSSDDSINATIGPVANNTTTAGMISEYINEFKEEMTEFFVDLGLSEGGEGDGSIVFFNGGNIVLNSEGDGFDSNGKVIMTGGKMIINGPEKSGNGSIDYDGNFSISGGEIIAIGPNSRMGQTPGESDKVNTINIGLENTYQKGVNIALKDNSQNDLLNINSVKSFQNIIFSSSNLIIGEKYILEIGGEIIQEITLNDKITKIGNFESSRSNRPLN